VPYTGSACIAVPRREPRPHRAVDAQHQRAATTEGEQRGRNGEGADEELTANPVRFSAEEDHPREVGEAAPWATADHAGSVSQGREDGPEADGREPRPEGGGEERHGHDLGRAAAIPRSRRANERLDELEGAPEGDHRYGVRPAEAGAPRDPNRRERRPPPRPAERAVEADGDPGDEGEAEKVEPAVLRRDREVPPETENRGGQGRREVRRLPRARVAERPFERDDEHRERGERGATRLPEEERQEEARRDEASLRRAEQVHPAAVVRVPQGGLMEAEDGEPGDRLVVRDDLRVAKRVEVAGRREERPRRDQRETREERQAKRCAPRPSPARAAGCGQ
jgi:hypothetical protein